MLVDDFEDLLLITAKFISRLAPDINVSTASSAKDALEMMKHTDFDIIVSDYQMPVKDGLEFLEEVRSSGNDIPFIIFTGRGREEVAIKALNLGATHYLKKGGDPNSQYAELIHHIVTAVNHKRSELALVESEEEYRTLVHAMTELIFVFDKDDYIRQIYSSDDSLLLKPLEDSIGQHVSDRMPSNFLENYYEYSEKVRQTGLDHLFDTKLEIDGQTRWFTDTLTLHEDGESIVDVARDITARKSAEDQLVHAKTLLTAIIEQSPIPMVVSNPDGEIILVNDISRQQLEVEEIEEYSTGMRWDTLDLHQTVLDSEGNEIPPDSFFLRKALRGEKTSKEEIKIVRSDGSFRYEEIHGVPVFDSDGKLIAAYTVFPDITKRKLAEEQLQKSEEMFRVLADSMTEGILVVNRDGSIEYSNVGFSKMWGISLERLASMDQAALLESVMHNFEHPETVRNTVIEVISNSEERFDIFRFKDGRVIEAYSRPLFSDEKDSKRVWIYREIMTNPQLEN
ncbi:MAG: PAS domain S-box protein [Candidatus Thorarchaeota archaeon]